MISSFTGLPTKNDILMTTWNFYILIQCRWSMWRCKWTSFLDLFKREWPAMNGGWTEYAFLWTNILGFISDVSTMYNYRVWAQSRRSNSWILVGTYFWKEICQYIYVRINYFVFFIVLNFLFSMNLFAEFYKFLKCHLICVNNEIL